MSFFTPEEKDLAHEWQHQHCQTLMRKNTVWPTYSTDSAVRVQAKACKKLLDKKADELALKQANVQALKAQAMGDKQEFNEQNKHSIETLRAYEEKCTNGYDEKTNSYAEKPQKRIVDDYVPFCKHSYIKKQFETRRDEYRQYRNNPL